MKRIIRVGEEGHVAPLYFFRGQGNPAVWSYPARKRTLIAQRLNMKSETKPVTMAWDGVKKTLAIFFVSPFAKAVRNITASNKTDPAHGKNYT
jgi:hypothetical protein